MRRRAAVVAAGCALLLGVALWLKPDPSGVGTHTQLGFAPCSLMVTTGIPCPTCGMTTAFGHCMRGRWLQAFAVQPAGCLMATAVMLALIVSVWELVTGRGWRVNWYRVSPWKFGLGAVGIILASWVYKIMATRPQMG